MPDDKEKIRKVLDVLRKKENVIGGSLVIQPREVNGKLTEGTEVVRVYVTKKLERDALSKKDLLPECVVVDGKTIEVDVIEIGTLKALSPRRPKATTTTATVDFPDPKLKYRPLRMGISTMNSRSTGACSLGTFARDNLTGKIVQLSNQHCFGLENDAVVGDPAVQPSRMDGGVIDTSCKTGEFVRGVELKFTSFNCDIRNIFHGAYRAVFGTDTNVVDVSCSSIYDSIGYEMKTPDGKDILGWKNPMEGGGDPWAYGRSSGYSHKGQYIDLSGYVQVGYRRGNCVFEDIVIGLQNDTFKCIPGDSGSPWFEDQYLIGLRFAGSDTTWIGCKWKNIERELDVSYI